jgi:hypothetical protein
MHIITMTKQSTVYINPAVSDQSSGAGAPGPELVAVVEAEVKAWIAEPWLDVESRGFEALTQRLLEALERRRVIGR